MKSPNIVIVMADQLAPQFCGAYGHPVAKTPHMDALAARGMRFDAAYCNAPLCAPSRFAFMSGQLISRIAAYDNASEFRASDPTFAHYLKILGYRTCLSGKMHFIGPDQMHIHCDADPPQLYDLTEDPDELVNRATDPVYGDAAARFAAEVAERWDSACLRADVIATQKSRRALHAAMEAGAGEAWDYDPPRDASQQYVRNHMNWTVAAARYRYPPRGEDGT